MTKAERTKLSKEKILNAAIHEFGTSNFANGIMNVICSKYGVSKGLVYHNFENKEDLYLATVERTLLDTAKYISEGVYDTTKAEDRLKEIIERIREYFDMNPLYKNLFFYSSYLPPDGLEERLKEKRKILFKTIFNEFSSFDIKGNTEREYGELYACIIGEGLITITKDRIKSIKDASLLQSMQDEILNPIIPLITNGLFA